MSDGSVRFWNGNECFVVGGGCAVTKAPTNLSAALAYAKRSWTVFPCAPGPGPSTKRPLTKDGWKDATTDAAAVEDFWKLYPKALIGVPTPQASGFFVADFDPRTDDDGG